MANKYSILMIEDSDEDFYTTSRTLARFQDFAITRCKKGAEVLEQLSQNSAASPSPHLILLDLNLPGKMDGREVLTQLKADAELRSIPVVILTTSGNPKDIEHCYSHGAGGYMVKPVDLDKFTDSIECMVKYWFDAVTLPCSANL